MDDLRGANALLTGAAGGLGRHIARALAAEGVRLALSGRHAEPLEELCRELRQRGACAELVLADLADPGQTAALIEQAEAMVGPLDLLVNNAGIEAAAAHSAFTDDELAVMARFNLIAPMVVARHALPGMLARGRGHIVTVSSLAGRSGIAYNACTRRRRPDWSASLARCAPSEPAPPSARASSAPASWRATGCMPGCGNSV